MPTDGLPRVLLFDLDDTILRFSAGQPNFWLLALERHLPNHADHAALLRAIESVSHEFWSVDAQAFWGRQNMLAARRRIACSAWLKHGLLEAECHLVADEMTEGKEGHARPFDGAIDTLHQLRERGHRLGLLTNGSSLFQRKKLQRFELEALFELILIEGELGYGKPDRRVFQAALDFFGPEAKRAWMIGDNLTADIAGAQALGLYTVWHDPLGEGLPSPSRVVPDRVIRSLAELVPSAR
jgi:putative hydrolase of the HAD superfamily